MLLPESHGRGLVLLEEEGDAAQGVPEGEVGEVLETGVVAPMRPVALVPEGLERPTAYPKPS